MNADIFFLFKGTGASIGNNIIVAGSIENQKDTFIETLDGVYPSVEFSAVPELETSSDVSDYILDSLQANRREFNFGSFVFGDTINANLNVTWSEFNEGPNNPTELLENLIFSQMNSTELINALNQTLSFLNIQGSEIFLTIISQVISDGGSLSDILNQTISFFNIDIDELEEALISSLFNGIDDVTLGGQNFTITLTEESVRSIFDGSNSSYRMSVQVPISILHNTSSAHR